MMLKRASPMPPMAFFTAKLFMCALFAAVIVCVLAVLGVTLGNVRMPSMTWLRLGGTLVLGAHCPSARWASGSATSSDRTQRRPS